MPQFFIMNSNLENEKSVTAGKMYPIDLAPQKITIVKSVPNSEVKIPHLIPGQPKNSTPGQIISHPGSMGLMRPTAQIISSGVSSQAQMIVSGSPLLQGTQIVTQGSQIIGQGSQIINTSQLINTSSQLLSPTTQIISQGTQLTNASSTGNNPSNNITGTTQSSVVSTVSGNSQTVNAGGQLIGAPSGLVVSSSVRTLPQNVRVLPPTGHNPRPVLSNMNLSSTGINSMNSVVVSKPVVSHVPRGPAAGASLAVPRIARPAAPISTPIPTSGTGAALPISSLGVSGAWNSGTRGNVRGAVVYSARATVPRALARVPPPVPAGATVPAAMPSSASTPNPVPVPAPAHSIALPATTVLTPSSVIASTVRGVTPRALTPTPAQPAPATPASRPIPLLQRNYHTTKVVGVAGGTVRTPVGNSAPSQLYYEVPRPPAPHSAPPAPTPRAPSPASALPPAPAPAHPPQQPASAIRTLSAYNHQPTNSQILPPSTVQVIPEARLPLTSVSAALVPRPSILRKREIDGSPTKTACVGPPGLNAYELVTLNREPSCPSQWDREDTERDGSGGGSTTVSAASSPEPDDEPLSPPRPATPQDISPRKKPRKQILSNDVRQCDFPVEEPPPTPPPPPTHQPKRPLLSSSFVCGWRATALHFTRPSDVRRREPRAKDIVAIANQPHALTSANGWKVHHLTAQMDDLVSLESDVGSQLSNVLRALESAHNKAQAALAPHSHALLELIKGNIQRSKIVCEGIQEAREDILRVFTHQTVVADILTRQADKRCFRKHRTQS